MKDLFELLNDIDVDESEIDEMPVTEAEKELVKKNIIKNINKKRKWNKASIAAAICFTLIGCTFAVGVINPAYASNIPIVGDIFRFFDKDKTGAYDNYKYNSTEINKTVENNGISVTMKDAIFDGQTIFFTYEIKTDYDYEDIISINYSDLKIKDYSDGMGGGSRFDKTGVNTYVGLDDITLRKEMKNVQFSINFTSLSYLENDEYKEIQGYWSFDMNLDAIDGLKHNINKYTVSNGVKITIDSITETPMSMKLNYTAFIPEELGKDPLNSPSISIDVNDDLGNKYETIGLSSFGSSSESEAYSMSVGKFNDNATKLILTPQIKLPSGGGGISIDENGVEETIEWVDNPNRELIEKIVFEDIVIDIN